MNDPNRSKLSSSRAAKLCLLLLSMLYFSIAVIDFIVIRIGRNRMHPDILSKILKSGLYQMFIAFICMTAYILVRRGAKIADLVAALAIGFTGLYAFNTWATALKTGFHPLQFVEPLIVLPSVWVVAFKLIQRKLFNES